MGSIPILCINVYITKGTMLKIDANTDVNINIDAQCERTLTAKTCSIVLLGIMLDTKC